MMTAFKVILIVVFAICGLGSITDSKSKHYIVGMVVTGILFQLSMLVEALTK